MRTLGCIVLMLAGLTLAATKVQASLPDKLVSAKTIYIENQTGKPDFSDEAYEELEKCGRFKVVTEKSKADLTVLLSRVTHQGRKSQDVVDPAGNSKSVYTPTYRDFVYLSLIDNASGDLLWSDSQNVNQSIRSIPKSLVKKLRKRMDEQTAKK